MYGQTMNDPLIGQMTSTTQFGPLQSAIESARQARLGAIQPALNAGLGGLNDQMSYLNQGMQQSAQTSKPYIDAGNYGVQQAQGLAGAFNPQQYQDLLQNNVVLKNINDQGLQMANQDASARGIRRSPAQQLALEKLGQANASQYIQQLFQNNEALARLGQPASLQQSTQQYGLGGALGNVAADQGALRANAALSAGDINASSDINSGKTAVAQSTVRGLGPGQKLQGGFEVNTDQQAFDFGPLDKIQAAGSGSTGGTGSTGSGGTSGGGGLSTSGTSGMSGSGGSLGGSKVGSAVGGATGTGSTSGGTSSGTLGGSKTSSAISAGLNALNTASPQTTDPTNNSTVTADTTGGFADQGISSYSGGSGTSTAEPANLSTSGPALNEAAMTAAGAGVVNIGGTQFMKIPSREASLALGYGGAWGYIPMDQLGPGGTPKAATSLVGSTVTNAGSHYAA